MTDFKPQSFLDTSHGLCCYDLEFFANAQVSGGFQFHNTEGLFLSIDTDPSGKPVAMTLIHPSGAIKYEHTSDYAAFLSEAQQAYAFATYMVSMASAHQKIFKAVNIKGIGTEIESEINRALFDSIKRAERFGTQPIAA